MGSGILGRYCPNCGYRFPGQRTGKCPNCGESAIIDKGRTYKIDPHTIREFDQLDRKGGMMKALTHGWPPKKTSGREIEIIAAAEDGSNVTLKVQGIEIIFYRNSKGKIEKMGSKKYASYHDYAQFGITGEIMRRAFAKADREMKSNQRMFRRRMTIIQHHQR